MSVAQAQQPPPSPPADPQTQHAALIALTVLMLANLPSQAAAQAAAPILGPLGVVVDAGKLALLFDLLAPHGGGVTIPTGPASLQVWATEPARRAAYVLSASTRLAAEGDVGRERQHLSSHLAAGRARASAAQRVDVATRSFGTTLGWYAVRDHITTPECRAAHGANFQVAVPPAIGYPGTPHGGTCRCLPGPPFENGRSVDEVVRTVLAAGHNH